MNLLKKTVTIIILFSVLVSSVFAATAFTPKTDVAYAPVANPYSKTSARVLSMGGAGIALRSNQDALYINPASLGEKGLVWNIPNVALTIYNTKKMVGTGIIDNYKQAKDNIGTYTSAILDILNGAGYNNLATIDAGVGAKLGRFAFALDTQVNMHTFTPDIGAGLDAVLIPQVDAILSTGLGLRFFRNSPVNFDFGVAARFNVRGYFEKTGAKDVLDNINDLSKLTQDLQEAKPLMFAYAIPVDLGFNLNLPVGFTFSAVARNLNGNFHAQVMDSLNYAKDNLKNITKGEIIIESPWSLDLGFGWKPKYGLSWLANPNIAIDLVDVIGLCKDFSGSNLLGHIKAGMEFELFTLLELRAGLNQGYVSIGAGVNLMNLIHLEASYYRLEFGEKLLDKPVDALTVRMNLFWER